MNQVFFVGSYTDSFLDEEAKGKGIYTCVLERSTGWISVEACFEECKNPSYLALDKDHRHLYAVQEGMYNLGPAVHAFSVTETSALEILNSRSVPGEAPCHLALSANKRFLTVANYATGNVLLYPIRHGGTIGRLADEVYHTGRSADPERQQEPHPHATVFSPDNHVVYVPDLGTDELKTYAVETRRGKLELLSNLTVPAGNGPRHLAFHPEGSVAFVINELASSLGVLKREGQKLTLLSSVSTLPPNFGGSNTCAAVRVHPSGDFIYASNRGHDSIAVFAYKGIAQPLQLIQVVSTQGRTPRDFALDYEGKLAVVANQQTNNLVSYWVDNETGKLEPTGYQAEIGTPACIEGLGDSTLMGAT